MHPVTHLEVPPLDDWYPLDELVAAFPKILSLPGLRWQLRHRDSNGLAQACVRQGSRLLISKTRYEHWLASRAGQVV